MDDRLKPYDEKMKKSYDFLVTDLGTIRAGRANPHVHGGPSSQNP